MPQTSFIVVVDHDAEFVPTMFHSLVSEMLVDCGEGGDSRTEVMNTVEVITAYDCDECSMPFDPDTLTDVMIIDGNHADQPMEIIKVCPGCMDKVWSDGWGYTNGYASPDDYKVVGEDEGGPRYELKGEDDDK